MFKFSPTGNARLVAFALLMITLAVNVSMPLFRVYATQANFSNGQTALVLAAYTISMLPCYIFLGGISDKLGRKPVLIASVCCAFLSTLVINAYPNVYALFFARLFQGIGLGLSMGTGTAYMAELLSHEESAPTKAANLASFSTAIGFSGGALTTTLCLLYQFTLQPVSYLILIVIDIVGILLLFTLPNLKPIGGNLVRLPYFPKGSLPINLSIGICWAVCSMIIVILPSHLVKMHLAAYTGFCLVLINWTGAFIQPFLRRRNPLKLVNVGLSLIPIGFGLVILGAHLEKLYIILIGTSVIGSAAYGFSYLGGLATIALMGQEHKARAVSGYMFVGYIGFGLPPILLGYAADQFGIVNSLFAFEWIVIALSLYVYWGLKRLHLFHQ